MQLARLYQSRNALYTLISFTSSYKCSVFHCNLSYTTSVWWVYNLQSFVYMNFHLNCPFFHMHFKCKYKEGLPLSWVKNRGRSWSMVFSLPSIGLSPMMTEAKADLTCWLASVTRSLIHGRSWLIMICSRSDALRAALKSVKMDRRESFHQKCL